MKKYRFHLPTFSCAILFVGILAQIPVFAAPSKSKKAAPKKAPPQKAAPARTQPEKVLTGFQGVNWGDSVAVARKKMSARKEFKFAPSMSNSTLSFYTGGKLGGEDISLIGFGFSNEGFFKATTFFEPSQGGALQQYKNVQALLKRKYGEPVENERKFMSPYYEGDGYEEQAIRAGKGLIFSIWSFPNKEEDDDLVLSVDGSGDELSVRLIYQNGARQKRQTERADKQNAEDF